MQRDAGLLLQGLEQRHEEHAAVQTDAEQRGVDHRVLEIDQRAPCGRLAAQPIEPRAALEDRTVETELVHHQLARGLEDDAGKLYAHGTTTCIIIANGREQK